MKVGSIKLFAISKAGVLVSEILLSIFQLNIGVIKDNKQKCLKMAGI
jgi:hypothetical protein